MGFLTVTPRTTVTVKNDIEMVQPKSTPKSVNQAAASSGTENQENDVWDPVPDLPAGYPKLAGFFACIPNAASFRRFNALNMRRLLYLQAELCHLEFELLEIEKEDADCSDENERKTYARDWAAFESSARAERKPGEELSKQWDLKGKIDTILKEYS
jgi:hypothetical protein